MIQLPGRDVGMQRVGDIYLARHSVVVGEVRIGADSSVWPFVSIRGDVAAITIGERCCIQDQTMVHTRTGEDLVIADDVAIGHQACVHCRSVGAHTLIGIGATVLDGAVIEEGCIVAAGAVVRPGERVAAGSLVAGVPARRVRSVTDPERAYIDRIIDSYRELARRHADGELAGAPPGPAG